MAKGKLKLSDVPIAYQAAVLAGQSARRIRRSKDANPYAKGSEKETYWNLGYERAYG